MVEDIGEKERDERYVDITSKGLVLFISLMVTPLGRHPKIENCMRRAVLPLYHLFAHTKSTNAI